MKALSPIAVLISALLLQGCVAAAVVGTAAVGTKAATDPRSVGTQVDDGTLEVRVNSALSKDEQIKNCLLYTSPGDRSHAITDVSLSGRKNPPAAG